MRPIAQCFMPCFILKHRSYSDTGWAHTPPEHLVVHHLERLLRLFSFSFTIYKIELLKPPAMWFLGGLNEINKIDCLQGTWLMVN